jgi:CheY-like chemotaxis protein/MinD-like ATPase involved in chromosome partitioning or flagellar assembly
MTGETMRKRILVIEDDPIATRLIEYVLKKRGYQVFTTSNGLEGIQIARTETPDIIILNVMLPGIDGLEVCQRLRAEKQTAQPLILMLSGKAQRTDIANGMSMGADDYLTKPAAPSEIVSRVESLLAQKAGAHSKTVVFIGSKERVGTTTIAVNVAAALAQLGKQVIAVDLCPYDSSISERLGIKPKSAIRRFPRAPENEAGRRIMEPALMIHETGVGVLRILQSSGDPEDAIPDNTELPFNKFRETTDYFLVDLPFQPTAMTRSLLSRCDLAIIVSDPTTEALTGVKSTITVLRFLGIPLKRIGAVVTDPVGTFSQKELPNIRSYIEPNIAVSIWGIIPYEASMTVTSPGPASIKFNNDCPMFRSIKELAQRIISAEITRNDISHGVVKKA